MPPWDEAALLSFVKARDKRYIGKILDLRRITQDWLGYIPETFPHYTRHTIAHSDEIILQLSKLLFRNNDPEQATLTLSTIEAYILIVAAYLHDVGMVVSNQEKVEILKSREWESWTTDTGGGAKRWEEVQKLRAGQSPPDATIRNFLADLETRFLIAEFARRTHTRRSADILTRFQGSFGSFAFDDPVLLRTISDVCFAHGLRPYELEDNERFPQRRDALGEVANVRFLAILLRIGDLLDMSFDRACPLLLNAACPLPADSLAHWTKYQRITHRLTAPDRIELIAECANQEEHRFLQDWNQWLVDEVRNAEFLMARAERHGEWRLPTVSLGGPSATIMIRPAAGATYIPSEWTFELDAEAVFQRLIYSVHEERETFIRELLQNAFDANRCQMVGDLIRDGVNPPEYPTQVDADRRQRYPVKVTLRTVEKLNPLSEEIEHQQVLSVDDSGIGMDKGVIQNYLLQVGRSYYASDEFRRTYGFVPASRFGIGFLSIFAVSDHVIVETYKSQSPQQDGPIRLTLTGPKNYLLLERGERLKHGTRVDVFLREAMAPGELTKLVSMWCRRVEFPVIVDDLTNETTIVAERADQFVYEIPDVTNEDAKFAVVAFPINRPGIEGELYVFAYLDARGESWADWRYAAYQYPRKHPQAIPPKIPGNLVCAHGISLEPQDDGFFEPPTARLDYRKEMPHLPLSRTRAVPVTGRRMRDKALDSRWEEILREHLTSSARASTPDGWKYKQRLIDYFPLDTFWATTPETIRLYMRTQPRLVSLADTRFIPTLSVVDFDYFKHARRMLMDEEPTDATPPAEVSSPAFTVADLQHLSDQHRRSIFGERGVSALRLLSGGVVCLDWTLGHIADRFRTKFGTTRIRKIQIDDTSVIGIECFHKAEDSVYRDILLNRDQPFIQWITRVMSACDDGRYGLRPVQFETLIDLLESSIRYGSDIPRLNRYLLEWTKLSGLPEDLRPPIVSVTSNMFRLKAPQD